MNVEFEFQSSIDESTGETRYVTFPSDCSDMFAECGDETDYDTSNKISKTRIDLRGTDTSSATSMENMFYNCFRLASVNLDNIDTSNVSSMKLMFRGCVSLTSLSLSGIDTANVTTMNGMFSRCGSLTTLDLSGFNTSKVTNMEGMFRYCSGLETLNLRNFDTSALSSTARMFADCSGLAELKVSRTFVVPSSYTNMFSNAKNNMKISGDYIFRFEETDGNLKSIIGEGGGDADKVYTVYGESGLSTSLKNVCTAQLSGAEFLEEASFDFSALFNATSIDIAYIGMSTPEQTIFTHGTNRTIAVALMNKTLSEIGYYPAKLQLTGTITLSGDNSKFNEKTFIVGDGLTSTQITLNNPSALPKTGTIVEANGTLELAGTEDWTLSDNITVKSGGCLYIKQRTTISRDATLNFE